MSKTVTIDYFLNILTSISSNSPKFLLLLGAGASASSGVKTSKDLIKEWRLRYDENGNNGPAKNQDWYDRPHEYSVLFKHHYSTQSARRECMEDCIEGSSPYWGYLYLALLIEKGIFNTIITTNFDDLINEACHAYTHKVRPIICSHESIMANLRLHSPRPKVLKIHGDVLFDDLKNTPTELQSLKESTKELFSNLASEYGLVVLGYGGNDETVMNPVCELLGDKNKFPNGIFWCLNSDSLKPTRLESFCDDERIHYVETGGFDSFMSQAYSALYQETPQIISDPFSSQFNKLSHLLNAVDTGSKTENSTLQNHSQILAGALRTDSSGSFRINLSDSFAGMTKFYNKEYEEAANFFLREISKNKTTGVNVYVLLFECFRHMWDEDIFNKACENVEGGLGLEDNDAGFLLNATLSLIHGKHFEPALKICSFIDTAIAQNPDKNKGYKVSNELNRLQIILHQGKQLSESDKTSIGKIFCSTDDPGQKFGCHILLENYQDAVDEISNNKEKINDTIIDWPITRLLPKSSMNKISEIIGQGKRHIEAYTFNFNIKFTPISKGK